MTPSSKLHLRLAPGAIGLLLFFAACNQPDTGVEELALIDPSGSLIYVDATDIDTDINPSCGLAETESSADDSSSSGSTSTSSSTSSGRYRITSSLTLQNYQRLDMRFVYDKSRTNFQLLPTSSTETTCTTTDSVVCSTGGALTCPTSDGVRCGGADTVNWVDYLSGRNFFARTGNIDYSQGFTLNANKDEVQYMELRISTANLSGVTLSARVLCITQN
ncbi:MAG: hypothetical protein K1X75_07985 [Leptospirales bacterium]|nr:hypothetical protein [Leptospirales bacterium]